MKTARCSICSKSGCFWDKQFLYSYGDDLSDDEAKELCHQFASEMRDLCNELVRLHGVARDNGVTMKGKNDREIADVLFEKGLLKLSDEVRHVSARLNKLLQEGIEGFRVLKPDVELTIVF